MSLILFSALAGAVQMVAPDHWMPTSIFSWQRGWTVFRTLSLSFLLLIIHLFLGLALYLALFKPLSHLGENHLATFSMIFLGAFGLLRALRFSRLGRVIYLTPRWSKKTFRGVVYLVRFLGPSEMLIPVLMKARLDQVSQAELGLVLLAFFLGSLASGSFLIGSSRVLWNRPSLLPRAIDWCRTRAVAYPVAAACLGALLLTGYFNHLN